MALMPSILWSKRLFSVLSSKNYAHSMIPVALSKEYTTGSNSNSNTNSWYSHSVRPDTVNPYESLSWKDKNIHSHYSLASIRISSFNLLAPCYKRLAKRDEVTGRRKRESSDYETWNKRAVSTIDFFDKVLYPSSDIIAFQELWLDNDYLKLITDNISKSNYSIYMLQRTGEKNDAVALAYNNALFSIKGHEHIYLCSQGDRVALLLWLCHTATNKNLLIASTHLSFPHNVFDRMNQMRQMQTLTEAIDMYISKNNVGAATNIILGDFNVEGKSPVCDHLRDSGYFSSFEVIPPSNSNNDPVNREKSVKFVSHRTHRHEDLGVDHIFFKPELEYDQSAKHFQVTVANSANSSAGGSAVVNATASNIHDNIKDIPNVVVKMNKKSVVPQECIGGVFVAETNVYPSSLSSAIWNEDFTISDHRPIGSTLIFGRNKLKEQSEI